MNSGSSNAAVAETERGIALAPNDSGNSFCLASGTRDWEADTMNWSGKPAEVLKIEEEATRRDPGNRDFHLMEMGMACYNLGRPAEAIPVLKRFDDAYSGFVDAQLFLTASYAASGMMQQARAEAAKVMKSSPGFSLKAGLFKGIDPQDRLISDLRKAGLS